jgi:hypothetical protein
MRNSGKSERQPAYLQGQAGSVRLERGGAEFLVLYPVAENERFKILKNLRA